MDLINYKGRLLTQAEINLLKYYETAPEPTLEQHGRWPVYSKQAITKLEPAAYTGKATKKRGAAALERPAAASTGAAPKPLSANEKIRLMLQEKREAQQAAAARASSFGAPAPKRAKFVTVAGKTVSTEINKDAFPVSGLVWNQDWDPTQETARLVVPLTDFALDQKQTLVLRMTVPDSSDKWGISLCPRDHADFKNVLYHFNPRSKERGGILVQNSRRDGQWEHAVTDRLNEFPAMFGLTFDTAIQIDTWGFHVTLAGDYQLSFKHRRPIEEWQQDGQLVLEVPRTDDYGNPQSLKLHQIWWGKKKYHPNQPTAEELEADHSGIGGGEYETEFRNLHISNIAHSDDPAEEALIRQELEDLFAKYDVEAVKVISGRGYGFINFKSAEGAAQALQETNGTRVHGQDIKVTKARSRG